MNQPIAIDKSRYQWIVNQQGALLRGPEWEKAWNKGIRIVAHRVTVGNYYVDAAAKVDYEICKSFGFLQTFYHVTTPENPADEQVDWFLGHLPGNPDLPLVIDNELVRDQNVHTITSCTQKIFQLTQEQTGVPPFNYTSQGFWDPNVLKWSGWIRYPLWVAWYPYDLNYPVVLPKKMCPRDWIVDGVPKWSLWQKWADGDAMGREFGMMSGDVDLSFYNGDDQDFFSQFGVAIPGTEPQEPIIVPEYNPRVRKPRPYFERETKHEPM